MYAAKALTRFYGCAASSGPWLLADAIINGKRLLTRLHLMACQLTLNGETIFNFITKPTNS